MREAKFDLGDVVCHKASGECGIIVGINMRCSVHPPISAYHMAGDRSECEIEFAGSYELSVRLGKVLDSVDEDVLEKVGINVQGHTVYDEMPSNAHQKVVSGSGAESEGMV